MTKEQIMEYVKMAILVLIGIMIGALLQKGFGDEDKRSESVAIYITIPNSGNSDAEITTKVGPEDNSTNNSNILPELVPVQKPLLYQHQQLQTNLQYAYKAVLQSFVLVLNTSPL